jgi:ribonuclease R
MAKQKMSLLDQVVMAILEDAKQGTLNAQRVYTRIPRDAHFDKDAVYHSLLRLVQWGKAEQPSKGNFRAIRPAEFVEGVLDLGKRGDWYLQPDSGERSLFLPSEFVHYLLPGDRVRCEFERRGKRLQMLNCRLLERSVRSYIGQLDVFEQTGYCLVGGLPLPDLKLDGSVSSEHDRHLALVEVYDWVRPKRNPSARLIEVLGLPGENSAEMHAIVAEFGFKVGFPIEVEQEVTSIPNEPEPRDFADRWDYRENLTFTIDPQDAKDFDDAISLVDVDSEHWEIGVHIADVAHYVKPNTALNTEALKRATSVYLVDRTIPMLPEKLSNGLCSLKPNVDRLAFSVLFRIHKATLNIENQRFGKSVIHSNRRFSYEEAQELIMGTAGEWSAEMQTLNRIAQSFEKQRYDQGALVFESKEMRFRLDPKTGEPIEVYEKLRFEAHKMIETYMLMANKAVAEQVRHWKKPPLPFVYRTHDYPPGERLLDFARFAKLLGYPIQIDNEAQIRKSFNELSKRAEGTPEAELLQQMAIRSMAKAVYTSQKTDHFGLAFPCYTHFTSPIRRYPDLLAHRMLFHYLQGGEKSPLYTEGEIEEMAKHSSNMEQKASEAERASVKYKMAELMSQHLGEVLEAKVTGVTEWGIYATSLLYHCEGLVRVHDMRGDRYRYYEAEKKMVGDRRGHEIRLGDPIWVRVKAASPSDRTIDMVLLDD